MWPRPLPPRHKSASVSENQTSAYDADATDAEGDTVTYSLSGGADAALFDIDASTGEVTFKSAPDFEAPGDDDGDNVYEVEVTASDGTNDTAQSVSITVTNTNDVAPVFSSFWRQVRRSLRTRPRPMMPMQRTLKAIRLPTASLAGLMRRCSTLMRRPVK